MSHWPRQNGRYFADTISKLIFCLKIGFFQLKIFLIRSWGTSPFSEQLKPLFHWPAMPRRSYGIRKNEQIRSKIVEMVWWNISGATILHMLRINCVSMAHGWRTCSASMAMPLRMMSRMRTWPLHIHGASGVQPTYAPRSTRFYGVWRAYVQRMGCVHAEPMNTPHYILVVTLANVWAVNMTFKCSVEYLNVQINLSNLISHVHHRNNVVLITGRMIVSYISQEYNVFHVEKQI